MGRLDRRFLPIQRQRDAAGYGDDGADDRAAGGAVAFEPERDGNRQQRRGRGDGQDEPAGRRRERPLVAADAGDWTAERVGQDPLPAVAPLGGIEDRGGRNAPEQPQHEKPEDDENESRKNAVIRGGETERGVGHVFAGGGRDGHALAADERAEALAARRDE